MTTTHKKIPRLVWVPVLAGLFAVCLTSIGCSRQASLEEKLAITKEYEVDYLTQSAKENPSNILVVQVSAKLMAAFDDVKKTNNKLEKPYLVNVFLTYKAPDEAKGKNEVCTICVDWFEKQFIPHSVRFNNKETSENWTYNFQCDNANQLNNASKGVRFLEEYQFGVQEKGGTLVSLENGLKLTELAKAGTLTAVLVDDTGTVLSNEITVDYIEILPPQKNTDEKAEQP